MTSAASDAMFLRQYVRGRPLAEDDFEIRPVSLGPLQPGQTHLRTLCLSVDPYLRGRMTGLPTFYMPQLSLDSPLHSVGVAEVQSDASGRFEKGDLVIGTLDWAEESLWQDSPQRAPRDHQLRAVHCPPGREAYLLGAGGLTGVTAFFGVVAVAKPRRGQSMVISAAAGGVGTVAGQIAQIMGATVVGLASSVEKRRALTEELGFDMAFDYRDSSLGEAILEALQQGPDIYFDNVGGEVSQVVMRTMRHPARVVECGQISTYDDRDGGWKVDIRPIHERGLRFQSFTPAVFKEFVPAAQAQLLHWIDTGQLKPLQSEYSGLSAGATALTDLFRSATVGKTIIRLASA